MYTKPVHKEQEVCWAPEIYPHLERQRNILTLQTIENNCFIQSEYWFAIQPSISSIGTSDTLMSHKFFLLFSRWINRRVKENAGCKRTGSQRLHDTSISVHEGEGSWWRTHHSYQQVRQPVKSKLCTECNPICTLSGILVRGVIFAKNFPVLGSKAGGHLLSVAR